MDKENPITGEMKHTATAYLTFVALDSDGKARVVPELVPETADEKRRFESAKKRRASRIQLAADLKQERN
ncbi:MAG: hypothetical protein EOP09_20490 [Proteobacteria bacterium]|nr:MAG: hypothetical protein EOP09_20490 [Pseudomonadota bacterium]